MTHRRRELQAAMSAERWMRVVDEGYRRAAAVELSSAYRQAEGSSWRAARRTVAADVDWASFRRWRGRYEELEGEPWERQLDERTPPDRTVRESIRIAAEMLRAVHRWSSRTSTPC